MFKLTEPVHRLVDMVVEEVSLVDRAANKHRFLIVKRDEAMEDDKDKDENKEEGEVAKEAEGTPLSVAVSALDGLTKIVEMLGQLGVDSVDPRVLELAVQLRSTTEQMLARLTGAEEPASEEKKGAETSLAEHIEAAKQAISQLATLAASVAPPATSAVPEPIPTEPPSGDAIGKLLQQFEALSSMVKEQQERLGRVEKNVGLPNSVAPAEPVAKSQSKEVSWPLDLNNVKDRENVDKSVSFHDL